MVRVRGKVRIRVRVVFEFGQGLGQGCKQTCQVPRNCRASPEITPDLQVSRKCHKMSRNLGNLSDFFFSKNSLFLPYLQKMCVSTHEYHSMWGKNVISQLKITENFCYYPQPHRMWSGAGEHGTILLLPPPQLSRVDLWISRKRLKKLNKLNLAALCKYVLGLWYEMGSKMFEIRLDHWRTMLGI